MGLFDFKPPPEFELGVMESSIRAAESLARKMFDLAEAEAEVEKQIVQEEFRKIEEEYPTDDEEADFEFEQERGELEGELDEIEERKQRVGALCLVYLEQELQSTLRWWLKRYTGTKLKQKLKIQYGDTLGIDFDSAPVPWVQVEELRLARNWIVHNSSEAVEKYMKNESRRLLTKYSTTVLEPGASKEVLVGRIVIDRERLEYCLHVFSEFLHFVKDEIAREKGFRRDEHSS